MRILHLRRSVVAAVALATLCSTTGVADAAPITLDFSRGFASCEERGRDNVGGPVCTRFRFDNGMALEALSSSGFYLHNGTLVLMVDDGQSAVRLTGGGRPFDFLAVTGQFDAFLRPGASFTLVSSAGGTAVLAPPTDAVGWCGRGPLSSPPLSGQLWQDLSWTLLRLSTVQPGQPQPCRQPGGITFSSIAVADPQAVDVAEPTSVLLLAFGGWAVARRRRSQLSGR